MEAIKQSFSLSEREIRSLSQSEYEAWLLNSGWEIVRERMIDLGLEGEIRQIEESGEEFEVGEAYVGEQRGHKTCFRNDPE